jgi:hypothetical protein
MKQRDVKLGGVYRAKVSNKLVDVRLDSVHHNKGWWATNLATGRSIHIKTAARLRFEIPPKRGAQVKSVTMDELQGRPVGEISYDDGAFDGPDDREAKYHRQFE